MWIKRYDVNAKKMMDQTPLRISVDPIGKGVMIMETFWTAYGLFWVIITAIIILVCAVLLPKVIYDRIKNKEDDYYSRKVRK